MELRVVCLFSRAIVLNCLILFCENGFAATPNIDVKNVVIAQDSAARAHDPAARLFQVFLSDFVPDQDSSERSVGGEIHSYFELHRKLNFLEVITEDSKAMVQLAKPFEGHSCFHGYPSSRPEACSTTVQAPVTESDYLSFEWTLNLPKLAAALRKAALEPNKAFDITIVSAGRVLETWKSLNVRTASGVRERMAKERLSETILSVMEHSSIGLGGGTTFFFRAADYECLGTVTYASSPRPPPARNRFATPPSPH